MQLNTAKSIELARQVKEQYGTWQNVIEASELRDGVYVICRPPKGAHGGEKDDGTGI